jgi:hypothetical protein
MGITRRRFCQASLSAGALALVGQTPQGDRPAESLATPQEMAASLRDVWGEAALRRDDRGHALVGFYGQLAQGMTRDTFLGCEGSRFFHGDRHGRSFYLPPNSASNAMFLTTLRYLLIQDWDANDDGRPDTLRLLYGAPERWLRDGAVLEVESAPTMFGPVSLRVESRLSRGEVLATLVAPPHRPDHFQLRLPLPAGWKTSAAESSGTSLPLAAGGVVDLRTYRDRFTLRFRAEQAQP